MKIGENLNWKHVNGDVVNANRINSLLFKTMNFSNVDTLKTIYSAILASHINYAIWFGIKI